MSAVLNSYITPHGLDHRQLRCDMNTVACGLLKPYHNLWWYAEVNDCLLQRPTSPHKKLTRFLWQVVFFNFIFNLSDTTKKELVMG